MRCPECGGIVWDRYDETEDEALKRHLKSCDGRDDEGFAAGECPMCGEEFGAYGAHLRRCPARADDE
ncbi:MAG: hypothetical protein ABEH58_06175 [Haloplanus sp.]